MKITCDYEDPRLVTTPVNNGIVLSFTHIVVCTRNSCVASTLQVGLFP
jgi:hypothetical protein